MNTQPLAGKKIGVLVEHMFIPEEIEAYRGEFAALGAEVEFLSRLAYPPDNTVNPAEFRSDVDPLDNPLDKIPDLLTVTRDIGTATPQEFAAVIMSANYTSVRLRYTTESDTSNLRKYVQSSPVVKFVAAAMRDPGIVKGALCHGLWILTPHPELLKGRKVVCNPVVLSDILNCGADVSLDPRVAVDGDLVTGFSKHEVVPFIAAIKDQILAISAGSKFGLPKDGLKKRILFVLSEWGFWGEELIGPLEVLEGAGYIIDFATPTGKRPVALPPSMDSTYEDPPLGKSVTSPEMAEKVKAINDPANKRLDNPLSLIARENALSLGFPERPYWSERETLSYPDRDGNPQQISSPLRKWEAYYRLREQAQASAAARYDAVLLVGGSGPMIDMVNNYRVHDLILGFKERDMPIAAECYGVACLAQARNFDDPRSILHGKHVTGHAKEYDYKNETGVLDPESGQVLTRSSGDWVNLGPPFYTLEFMLRDATGPEGGFHGNVGRATSVVVDYPFITGRSTPDSYMTGEMLLAVLEHNLTRYGW